MECRESFYSALQSADYTALRKLYDSQPGWRTDIGNAVGSCFDVLADTGKSEKDLVLFWAPDDEPGEKVIFKSNELSWIGFLEDTETSGTLAVLENKCLKLPDLDIGRKCLSNHFDPRHIGSGLSTGTFHGPVLETSVYLNRSCVPNSIRDGRIRSKRRDGTPSSHSYRLSLLSLEEGDKFEFGRKGSLKAITQLTQGQMLAEWSSSLEIKRQLHSLSSKIPVLGRIIDEPPPNIHDECIRVRKEDTSPVSFIILSTAKTMLHSARVSRRPSFHATSSLVAHPSEYYHCGLSASPSPQGMLSTPRSVFSQEATSELRGTINRWRMRALHPPELSRQEWE